jgi:hypothetical protein
VVYIDERPNLHELAKGEEQWFLRVHT